MSQGHDGVMGDLRRVFTEAALFDISQFDHVIDSEVLSSMTRDLDTIERGTCAEALLLREDGSVDRHLDVWMASEPFAYAHAPNPNDATHSIMAVVGPLAAGVVGAVLGDSPGTGHVVEADWNGHKVMAAGNGPVYGMTITVAAPLAVGNPVRDALVAEGAAVGSPDAFSALRVQAGELDWSSPSMPDVNPVEADLTHLVDPEARFLGRRAYRRALRRGNSRAIVGFVARSGRAEPGARLRAGESLGEVISVMRHPDAEHPVGMGWLEPAPVFHRGSKAHGDPLPQLEIQSNGEWSPVSLADPPFNKDLM